MILLLWPLLAILASPFKSKRQLEAENVALRHQVVVLRRQVRDRVRVCTEKLIRSYAARKSANLARRMIEVICNRRRVA
jgi:hypothetical protein